MVKMVLDGPLWIIMVQQDLKYCQTMSRFFGEIVPQVEMEILRRSLAFYRRIKSLLSV